MTQSEYRLRLNKSGLSRLKPRKTVWRVWDSAIPGFHVRVHPTGKITFKFRYTLNGRQKEITLGIFGAITVELARELAAQNAALVATGNDPQVGKSNTLTFNDGFQYYYTKYMCSAHKSKHARESLRGFIQKWVTPKIGNLRLLDVTEDDIDDITEVMRKSLKDASIYKALVSISHCYNWLAEHNKIPAYNPVTPGMKPARGYARPNFLIDPSLYIPLLQVIEKFITEPKHKEAARLIKTLFFTSARYSEIADQPPDYCHPLRHSAVKEHLFLVPLNKEGNPHKSIDIPEVLWKDIEDMNREAEQNQTARLFSAPSKKNIYTRETWNAILDEVRSLVPDFPKDIQLRDLRKIMMTEAVNMGFSLEEAGSLGGHTSVQTTAKYYAKVKHGRRRVVLDTVARMVMDQTKPDK